MLPIRAQETIDQRKFDFDNTQTVKSRHNFDGIDCSFDVVTTDSSIMYDKFTGEKNYIAVLELVFSQLMSGEKLFSAKEYDYFFRDNTSIGWGIKPEQIESIISFLKPIIMINPVVWNKADLHLKSQYFRIVMPFLIPEINGEKLVNINKNDITLEGFSPALKEYFKEKLLKYNSDFSLEFL